MPLSCPELFMPKRPSVFLAKKVNEIPNGLTTADKRLTGGTISRATFSALFTPTDLGSNSTKNKVSPVKATAPYRSPRVPKNEAAICVKRVVAKMEQNVDVTRIVVNTRVISSLRILKVPRPFPSFSSSSANSRTFHGYSVVMAISTACNNANAKNSPNHNDTDDMASLRFIGGTGPADPATAIARARRGFKSSEIKNIERVTSKCFLWKFLIFGILFRIADLNLDHRRV
mmetsp:Transcript_12880/g.18926  ORF Transcript_12880/g.18926 Transcript_12880/m.18926 type:complete len:230 (-) Transcript_12880:256-945(-)